MRKLKKVPIQIYLHPDQDRILTVLSKTTGKSKAGIIRACIEEFIAELPREEDPLLELIGLGSSHKGDIAERHDDYLTSFQESV